MTRFKRPGGLGASSWPVGVAAVLCLFVSRLALVSEMLPPWQNPDEPAHFAVVRALARYPSIELAERQDFGIQAEIMRSMANHGWWEAYGEVPPSPLPSRFLEIPARLGDNSFSPPLYYVLASRYCRLIGADSLLGQYFALRFASLAMSLGTLWVIMLAARRWFDELVSICTGALVALVPQFVLMSIAVSPDVLVYLCGAVVWWQAARLFAGQKVGYCVLLMVASTVLAVAAKRSAAPLIIQSGLLALWGVAVAARRRGYSWLHVGSFLTVAVTGAVCGLVLLAQSSEVIVLQDLMDFVVGESIGRSEILSRGAGYFFQFSRTMFSGAYLAGGWLRFWAPPVVIDIALGVVVIGVVRAALVVYSLLDPRSRLGAYVASVFILVQLVAIYGTIYYNPGNGTQGRFFFGSIGPIAALCAIGLATWPSRRFRAITCSVAVGVMLVLDLVSWGTVMLPAYVR